MFEPFKFDCSMQITVILLQTENWFSKTQIQGKKYIPNFLFGHVAKSVPYDVCS